MAAKDIVEAFEKEYYPMDFFTNQQCSQHFTKGWCAAKAVEVQKPSHNTASLHIALTLLEKWTEWYASAASVPVGDNFALLYQTHEFIEEQRQA